MWLFYVLLCTLGWALVNVLDSVLVHHYEKRPITLMWCQSMWSVPMLCVLAFFLPLEAPTMWIAILLLMGVIGYCADLQFLHTLEHIDVSVANVGWSLLSILLALAGFLFFHESWHLLQSLGALLILSGVLLVSLYQRHVRFSHTVRLLLTLATLFAPIYIIKKAAVNAGIPPSTVFFWLLIARESIAFITPWFLRDARTSGFIALRSGWTFSALNAVVIVAFLSAEYFGARAYQLGALSLVTIVSNIQPFIVMGMAWFFGFMWPEKLPKELLTKQSVQLKVTSFSIVFIGLALLIASK